MTRSAGLMSIAAVIALLVGFVPIAAHIVKNPDPQAAVTLRLGDRAVRWPYHSSIQRNSWSWFNLPEADDIASSSDPDRVTVEADTLLNNQELTIRADGSTTMGAITGLTAVVEAFLEYDMALQRDPIEAELALVQADRDQLETAFLISETEIGRASDPTELILLEAELEGLGASIGGIEGEKAEILDRLSGVTDRYTVIHEPSAVPALQNALFSTFLLALAAFVLAGIGIGVANARRLD